MVKTRPTGESVERCCGIALTDVVENYLKALFTVTSRAAPTTSAVAAELGVASPTVSAMLKRLEENALVRRSGQHEISLTEHGRDHALAVVRRHRLVETFLAEVLDVPWDEVHAEAEILEHAISPRLAERIDARLGHPTHDPHGDPIPPAQGRHEESWGEPLAAAPTGSRFTVERVSDRDSGMLRHLAQFGVRPGVVLDVVERTPYGGPLWVEVDGARHPLGGDLAAIVHGRVQR